MVEPVQKPDEPAQTVDLAMLTVATRQLRALVES